MRKIRRFLLDETGAITVDWVALTFGILLSGIVVIYSIYGSGVSSTVSGINANAFALSSDLDPGPAPKIVK